MKQLKNYLSILSMLIALSLLTFISCTPDAEKEDLICKVSVEISEGGIGVVSNSEVVSGEEVTLNAIPEATYRFVNWTVNGKEVSKENPFTTTITATTQFKPNFEKDNYTIKVTAGEGGEVTPTEETVLNGSKVTLTATPNEGYSFINWTVNGEEVSKEATYTATITADTEFKANFKKTKGEENDYVWVDLGLPSGLKWATCNVGAKSPEEYGDYFAWGETAPKNYYDWNTYKYCNGSYDTMTKYCTTSSDGTVDNKTTLEFTDDAARVNWGGKWRMPTDSELEELKNKGNCAWEWTTQNGVNGCKVTSKKNGNSIFLPAAGFRSKDYHYGADGGGLYWSSSLNTSYSSAARNMHFYPDTVGLNSSGYYRISGMPVRAVCE